ncbi:MAG TPA: glycoside hydrolase family 97 catalytic domain-containing protein [Opitutaceae bacterium]|nr:glycoside hydrolase family 97 catalytic domain-containing protein [Opitutaceae bacterium]
MIAPLYFSVGRSRSATKITAWLFVAAAAPLSLLASELASPDGRLVAEFRLNADGAPRYAIRIAGHPALEESKLGLVRDDADFSTGLKLAAESAVEPVRDDYEILTAKRRMNHYAANRKTFHLLAAGGRKLDIFFQVSNDGVAFRYFFPETSAEVRRLRDEVSSFHFPAGTRAWLQPMSAAKTGWAQVNPCYEEFYEKDIAAGTPSPLAGWVYPALFRSGDTWLLVTEGSLGRNYCGTRLRAESPDREYSVGFPDPRENFQGGAVNPESTLPWATPWRVIVVGSLKTVAESTLGIDLADPPQPGDATPPSRSNPPGQAAAAPGYASFPGKATWSWPLMGDRNTNYDVQKKFIDYAADMSWRYTLIDALWDKQIGYEKVKELIDYARTKNVAILLWYNSAGDWCAAPQTPRSKLLTHESRVAEFARLKEMGVAGLKIDFFGGDGQSMIGYYHDILADAAPFGFALNFHGATLPRGWQRTFPQLMTMEAIKGEEYVTFEQKNADEEPTHAAMLPFTRNVFDPMDFTPVALDRINDRVQRRTTSAFELALSVVFTSGITHYAEIPAGLAKAPDYVREFLKHVPSVWDDVKFLDGFPGKFVALARRGDGRWYLAGINGEAEEKQLSLDLRELKLRAGGAATLIRDGGEGNLSFREETPKISDAGRLDITLAPHGGFVAVFE